VIQLLILIRRSQGQIYNTVGIYLFVNSHEEFYNALSKATTQENILTKINNDI
jgi:hypothetical protein